jgi:hypothetical protein
LLREQCFERSQILDRGDTTRRETAVAQIVEADAQATVTASGYFGGTRAILSETLGRTKAWAGLKTVCRPADVGK